MIARVRWLLAATLGAAGLAVVPVVAAPSASACPSGFSSDPYTGQCYAPGSLPFVRGIPCIPGQSLGTCLSILQNQPLPGGGAPPGGPWP